MPNGDANDVENEAGSPLTGVPSEGIAAKEEEEDIGIRMLTIPNDGLCVARSHVRPQNAPGDGDVAVVH